MLTSYSYLVLLKMTINAEIAEYAKKNRSTYLYIFFSILCALSELCVKIKLSASLSGFSAKLCRIMLHEKVMLRPVWTAEPDRQAHASIPRCRDFAALNRLMLRRAQHDRFSNIVTLSLSKGCRRVVEGQHTQHRKTDFAFLSVKDQRRDRRVRREKQKHLFLISYAIFCVKIKLSAFVRNFRNSTWFYQ